MDLVEKSVGAAPALARLALTSCAPGAAEGRRSCGTSGDAGVVTSDLHAEPAVALEVLLLSTMIPMSSSSAMRLMVMLPAFKPWYDMSRFYLYTRLFFFLTISSRPWLRPSLLYTPRTGS